MGSKHKRQKKKLDQWREQRREYQLQKSFKQLGINVEQSEITSGVASELAQGKVLRRSSIDVESGPVQIGLDDEVQFSCNRAGKCCFGQDIVLTPYDVWELIQSPGIRSWGYWSTPALYIKNHKDGLLDWFLSDQSGLPIAYLLHIPLLPHKKDSIAMCRLAKPIANVKGMKEYVEMMNEVRSDGTPAHVRYWRDDRGMPVFHCVAQGYQPTVCRSYPIGRILAGGSKQLGDPDLWNYVWDKTQCATCFVESFDAPKRTLRQYLQEEGLMERYEQVNLWNDFCCWMLENVSSLRLRNVAGHLAYDFDSVLLKGGAKTKELPTLRPKTFKDLIDRVRLIVENSMRTFGCNPQDNELIRVVSEVGSGW